MKTRLFFYIGLGSLIYAVTIVWGGMWLFLCLKSLPWPFAVGAYHSLILQTVIAFLPFGIFLSYIASSLKEDISQKTRQRLAHAVFTGLACSLTLWGFYYYDSVNGEGGANIGLGILILISPIFISGAMLWVFNWGTYRNS